jgi:hypothetical protein
MIHPMFGVHDMSGMTCSMADVLIQASPKGHRPPEGEYWVVKDGEVIFKSSDPNKAQERAGGSGGIMVFPNGSFYIFSIYNPSK